MELRPDYKQTDIGLIPKDWEVNNVSNVCTLINGRGFKPHEWGTSGLPIIRIQNLNGSEDFNHYTGDYDPKILVNTGQLLFAWSGSRGTSFGPYIWNGGRALLNYHTWKVAVKEIKVTQQFLFHALRHLTSYIEDKAHGASALVHTQKWEMEKFSILIPSNLPEQNAIADALSDVDALIASLDKLITKKRDIKQTAMQQLLTGKQRLPGFSGVWELKRLDELGTWKGGMTPSMQNPDYWRDGTIPWISSGDVKSMLLTETGFSITVAAVEQGKTSLLPPRSVLVVTRSGILRKYLPIAMNVITMVINQDIKALLPNAKVDSMYLLHALTGNGERILARCLKSGTTVESIEFSWLKAFTIPLPPLDEQVSIAAVLSDMDAEVAALETRRDKTRALKQGMMQELLTGRIRLV